MSDVKCTRVFVDAHVFDNEYQGTRTFIREMYALIAQKPDIQLYLAAHNIENLRASFPNRDNVHFIGYRNNSSYGRLLYDIPSLIRKHNIEYAHFQYISPAVKKCRYIVTIHDVIFNDYPDEFTWQYRLVKQVLFKRSALKADIVTTVSEFSRQSIHKHLRADLSTISVLPNGVGNKFFESYDKQKATGFIKEKYGIGPFILYVSRIEPRKNHIALLKAYLELELYQQGYYLVFLGHQSIGVPALNEILDGLPDYIKKFIIINSAVNDTDLIEFYRAATVFVYPSRAEGFGIPPLEAAALRIPVICSNTSAMSDFSFFGENHIDPFDNSLLKTRLHQLLTHPLTESYLAELSQIIHEKYTWAQSAEKLYRLIINDKSVTSERKK